MTGATLTVSFAAKMQYGFTAVSTVGMACYLHERMTGDYKRFNVDILCAFPRHSARAEFADIAWLLDLQMTPKILNQLGDHRLS